MATNPRFVDYWVDNALDKVPGTEASGVAVIPSGSTSVVVTHGLPLTPTVDDIYVTPAEDPTNSVGMIWVDTITSTTFTIHVEADPGASNLSFGWKVASA